MDVLNSFLNMLAITLVLALAVSGIFANPIQGDEESRIIGGRPAGIGEVTHVASLRYTKNGAHFCGGSVISIYWILTAAGCIENMNVFNLTAVVGTNYLNAGGKSYYISQLHTHHSYNPETHENDIALLRVLGRISGQNRVSITNLAYETIKPGITLTMAGWGSTDYSSTAPSNDLQIITLRSISAEECQKLLPEHKIFSTQVCTFTAAGQGTCHGDAGTSLFTNATQYGIASWGVPCAKGKPDVFTNVASYREWISSYTRE